MISFNFIEVKEDFDVSKFTKWLQRVSESEDKRIGNITYIFCSDAYLLGINQQYLNHDTYTDIITFDNSIGNSISADIFISVDRVVANAIDFEVSFEEELKRVVVHGILHLCGYKDKTKEDATLMRIKEDEKIRMFHVEQD